MQKKCIVLCADDYGQALEISQAIIQLLRLKRISATSCIVNSEQWPEAASLLKPFCEAADIGLHLNLTEGRALSKEYEQQYGPCLLSLPQILYLAHLRRLHKAAIEAECYAQLQRFKQELGCLPNYIDGHHHVHQFPVIREIVIKMYCDKLLGQDCYVRLPNLKLQVSDCFWQPKKLILYAAGVGGLSSLLKKNDIPHNQSFAGVYTFLQTNDYRTFFQRFLKEISDQGLIMCHPGLVMPASQDRIAQARYEEYAYFISDNFLIDCERMGVQITRFITHNE